MSATWCRIHWVKSIGIVGVFRKVKVSNRFLSRRRYPARIPQYISQTLTYTGYQGNNEFRVQYKVRRTRAFKHYNTGVSIKWSEIYEDDIILDKYIFYIYQYFKTLFFLIFSLSVNIDFSELNAMISFGFIWLHVRRFVAFIDPMHRNKLLNYLINYLITVIRWYSHHRISFQRRR